MVKNPGGTQCLQTHLSKAQPNQAGTGLGLFLLVGKPRKDVGLGSVRHVTLKQARKKARRNQVNAREGNGLATDSPKTIPTFEQAAKSFITETQPSWKNSKATKE
ncbi:MAG: hypothetical protein OXK72_01540 [Gammaproteobacteria bacterium]|nr:hypothetical protein [Gammaproteobacteria bacterium]MDE0411749.1 hypothetical protein [Gammaproteobacteria bacterium]